MNVFDGYVSPGLEGGSHFQWRGNGEFSFSVFPFLSICAREDQGRMGRRLERPRVRCAASVYEDYVRSRGVMPGTQRAKGAQDGGPKDQGHVGWRPQGLRACRTLPRRTKGVLGCAQEDNSISNRSNSIKLTTKIKQDDIFLVV